MTEHPPIYTMTFKEVEALAATGATIVSADGYLLSAPHRQFDSKYAFYIWSANVDNAVYSGKLKPADSPKRSAHIKNQIVNVKGKPFSWSPSAINDFLTCPLQYAARRFYLTLPYTESEAMRQGTIEHAHLEHRAGEKKTPLPEGYTRGEKYVAAFEKTGGTIIPEQELAITEDLRFVSWFDKKAWGRCKIDITLELEISKGWDGRKLNIFDWKTGKIKEDTLQLKINTWMLALKNPNAEEFVNRFIWLKFGQVTPGKGQGEYTREDIPQLEDEIMGHLHRMKEAWRTEEFQPRASGLCRNWCAVTACQHCGKGR